MHPDIAEAINWWCETTMKPFSPLTKGSNIFSEHYSAVQADVPDPKDPSTLLNETFIQALAQADVLLFAGQALDFCVANTMRDIANNFGDDNIKKMRLIIDGTSRVNAPGVEHLGDDFLKEMTGRGMQVIKTTDF
jgi:nicotinamidase-related amidase